jgi:DNA repair ATPase RecN
MEKEFKRNKLIEIWNGIKEFNYNTPDDLKFNYLVAKNQQSIEKEICVIQELEKKMKKIEGYSEYSEKIEKIKVTYSKTNEKGEIIEIDNENIKKEIFSLNEEYSETLKKVKESNSKYLDFLEESVKIEIYEIKLEIVPKIISLKDMNIIISFIIE